MSSEDDRDHPRVILHEYEEEDIDADEDLAKRFYGAICEQVDQGHLEEGGRAYQQLLLDGPPFDEEDLITISESSEERDCVRLTALFYFFNRFRPLHYMTHSSIETFEELSENFDEETMYHYCVFLCYRESQDPSLREKAFMNGVDAAEAIETASNLQYEVASLGEEIVRESEMSDIAYYGEYVSKEELLAMACKCGEKSISSSSELYDYYLTYASILEILDDYEKALDVLRSGRDFCVGNHFLERPDMGDLSADQVIPTFDERIEAVQKDRKRNQLEKSLRNARTRIDGLNSDIDTIETEIEEITDRYRSQVIQFIGFFGAILTIALTSIQIATQLTFPQSGGLILTLIGGIIIAFGELSVLFDPDTKRNRQYIITLSIGLVLIAVGLGLGIFVRIGGI